MLHWPEPFIWLALAPASRPSIQSSQRSIRILVFCLASVLLTACGAGDPDSPNPDPANAQLPPPTDPAQASATAEETLNTTQNPATLPTENTQTASTSDAGGEVSVEEQSENENDNGTDAPPASTPNPQAESPATTSGADAIQRALDTGRAHFADTDSLLSAALEEAQSQLSSCESTLHQVFPAGLISTIYPYLSNYVYNSDGNAYPLHVAADTGAVYSWLGQRKTGSRFAYYGSGVFTQSDSHYWGNLGTTLADNTLAVMNWLVNQSDGTTASEQPLRILALNLRAQQQIEAWAAQLGIGSTWEYNTANETNPPDSYDLLVGLVGGELSAIDTALSAGKPLLLWSEVFNPGSGIHKLGLRWNWWGEQTVGTAESIEKQCQIAFAAADLLDTLEALRSENLQFTATEENCPQPIYTRQCRADELLRADNQSLQQVFLSGVQEIQQRLNQLDADGTNVFAQTESDRLLQLVVLLGDSFRANITYPMDFQSDQPTDFFRALFADYANHYARPDSPAQLRNGDFSPNSASIAELSPTDGVVRLQPTPYSDWNSTGFTARAGEPVTLTREDSNPITVSVRVNMLRSQSTKIWNDHGFVRPLFTSSHTMTLAAGASITLSSPIGGPLYIHWDAVRDNEVDDPQNQQLEIEISGAVAHPLLDKFTEDHIQEFATALSEQPFDWVDIKTPFTEVHSRRANMLASFDRQNPANPADHSVADVQQWVDSLNTYLIESALSLAGFVDAALPAAIDITAFCQDFALDCDDVDLHRKPALQHIVSDLRASCGDLCSGNPFDTNSPVDPLGFGEAHEMGHNLQRARLNFHGARSLESSNNIFPHHVAWRWLNDNASEQHPTIQLPNPQSSFQQLQNSVLNASEPGIGHPIWADSQIYVNADVRLMLYLQLVFIHHQWEQHESVDATGWNLYTKLYKLEREYTRALASDASWNSERTKLGFSTINRTDAQSISGNDFMAVALAWISGRDHRSYLSTWGIDIGGNAQAQIDANGFSATIPLIYWKTPADRYARAGFPSDDPVNALPLDGTTQW